MFSNNIFITSGLKRIIEVCLEYNIDPIDSVHTLINSIQMIESTIGQMICLEKPWMDWIYHPVIERIMPAN
jgi:hypothetical protein